MTKRTRKSGKASSSTKELVVVAAANSMDEAKDYEAILRNNKIKAVIKQQQDEFTEDKRYVVMVQEDLADEANVIIESQNSYDDYDSDSDSDSDEITEDDLEGDVFDD
jgi:hypothetical protein